MTGRRVPAAFAAAAIVALAAAPASADRGAAEYFSGRGDAALKAKNWADAEEQFRRALQEDGTYLPARHGLAQALLGAGRAAPGVEELRKFVADVAADAAAPADWKALAAKAEKQLQEIDAAGAELRKILERYADELAGLARKWEKKDPRTAERAARRVLELRPGDRDATGVIERLGGSAKGPPVVLFNGKDLSNWESVRFPPWQVEEGVILGDTREGAYLARVAQAFEGDRDARCEGRFSEERAGTPMLGLLSGWKGDYSYYFLGIMNRKVTAFECTGEGQNRYLAKIPLGEFKGTLDVAGWNAFEVRYRGDEIEFLVNGTTLAKETVPEARRGGFVGLYLQDARVCYRRVEVQPR